MGAESLIGLASDMRRKYNINFRERMRDYGKHCVVMADIPIKQVPINDLSYLYNCEEVSEPSILLRRGIPGNLINIKVVNQPNDYHRFVQL